MSSILIPWYNGMENPYHIPLIPTSYHSMSPYTIPFHLIPYHVTSYHHSKADTGCLGPFPKYENYFCRLQYWSIGHHLCEQVLQVFADILSYKWRLDSKVHPLKISSIGLYPMFCHAWQAIECYVSCPGLSIRTIFITINQYCILCHFIQFSCHMSQAPMICPKCHTCPVSHGPCIKALAGTSTK